MTYKSCHEEKYEEECKCKEEKEYDEADEKDCLSKKFLELADEAWMCVLKDKLKKEIESSCGEHLSQLAKVISDTNNRKWAAKMEAKKHCHEFQEKILQLLLEKQQ